MKHDEAPKTQEIRKKEPALAMVITYAIRMKTETQEGVQDDTAEVDKNDTDEALFNRENAPEVRTETQRKPKKTAFEELEAERDNDGTNAANAADAAGRRGDGEGQPGTRAGGAVP
jgi:hypothetical protein